MDLVKFIFQQILSHKSLYYLWIVTIVYLIYCLPQFFKIQVYGSFEFGLTILVGIVTLYPFFSLSVTHPWWYWLLFFLPTVIIFFWGFKMYELNSYNGEGAIIMLIPVFLLFICGGASLVIRLAKYLF